MIFTRTNYDWRYVLEKDSNVEGEAIHALDRLFQERRKQSGTTYGVSNNVTQPTGTRTVTDLDLSVFDENEWILLFFAGWHYFGHVRLVRRDGHFGGMVRSRYDGYSEISNNGNLDFN